MRGETDVETTMIRVEASLEEAGRSSGRPGGVIPLGPEGDREVNVGRVRHGADIDIDLPSGSDRPLVGGAIHFAKRVLRRSLRWYIGPIVGQQSRFNHATLDLVERLRLRLARVVDSGYPDLVVRIAACAPWFDGCQRVVHLDSPGMKPGGSDLAAFEPGSVDGAFVSLVAQPRSARELVDLLDQLARALRGDGVLVIETARPEDLAGPVWQGVPHRPLHPEAVQAALPAAGFSDGRLEEVGPAPAETPDPNNATRLSPAEEIERIDVDLSRRRTAALIAVKKAR